MTEFFRTNIDRRGRIVRVIWGVLTTGGGIVLLWVNSWAAIVLIAAGIFSFFEAARGWCVMRACGIKTKW